MPRHSREDDRRRSSPYHSSEEHRSHHHQKHKVRDSEDDNGFRRKDTQSTVRYHESSRSNDQDYGNRGTHESSRYHKHGNDRDKHYRPRSPSRSDGKSVSKRSSGFDVGPPGAAALPYQSEGNVGISCPAMLLMGLRDVEYMPTRNGCSSSRTFSSSTATIVIW